MKIYCRVLVLLFTSLCTSQEQDMSVLSFGEYIGYVKKYHPIAKQAQLTLQRSQAQLMKARGGFDPKIEIDKGQKVFKTIDYYDQLNATFKIPTWYGIELKANFEQNDGVFLNPQNSVPDNGLYSAGISASLGQGLFINKRMADLKKAKLFRAQAKIDRDILVNQIIYNASIAYFNWLQTYNEVKIYEQFLQNARTRFNGVKRSSEAGDKASIDSVEAKITVKNRALSLEQARVKLMKSALELSTFLWLNNNIPVELQDGVIPDVGIESSIDDILEISAISMDDFMIDNHPKLQSLHFKYQSLEIDKRLKANKLLPKIDVQYNFLTTSPDVASSFNVNQYKGGFNIAIPLFLRKERGDLKLAKTKLQETQFDIDNTKITIKNKIIGLYRELESFQNQNLLIKEIVSDYTVMYNAEERKFSFGESSVFLVNTREKSLIDSRLKAISLQNKYLKTKAKLFNSLAKDLQNLE